jgi:hypothetical protein
MKRELFPSYFLCAAVSSAVKSNCVFFKDYTKRPMLFTNGENPFLQEEPE